MKRLLKFLRIRVQHTPGANGWYSVGCSIGRWSFVLKDERSTL